MSFSSDDNHSTLNVSTHSQRLFLHVPHKSKFWSSFLYIPHIIISVVSSLFLTFITIFCFHLFSPRNISLLSFVFFLFFWYNRMFLLFYIFPFRHLNFYQLSNSFLSKYMFKLLWTLPSSNRYYNFDISKDILFFLMT